MIQPDSKQAQLALMEQNFQLHSQLRKARGGYFLPKSKVLKEAKESEDDFFHNFFWKGAVFLQYVQTNSESE